MEKLIKLLTEMNMSEEVIEKYTKLDPDKQELAYQVFTADDEKTELIIEILDEFKIKKLQ